jgi:hypothetical protein
MDLSDYGRSREPVIPAKAEIQYVFSSRRAANQSSVQDILGVYAISFGVRELVPALLCVRCAQKRWERLAIDDGETPPNGICWLQPPRQASPATPPQRGMSRAPALAGGSCLSPVICYLIQPPRQASPATPPQRGMSRAPACAGRNSPLWRGAPEGGGVVGGAWK